VSKFVPKTKDDYTPEEKIAIFDMLIAEARDYYDGIMSGEIHDDNDYPQYFFEDDIKLLGNGVWDVINEREE